MQPRISPDGTRLAFTRVARGTTDIWINDLQTGAPDGKWLAFVTDRSGRPKVVLTRLVEDGGSLRVTDQRLPVSSSGGIDPHWRSDGRELVYDAPDRMLMAVSVTATGSAVALGKPVPLFRVLADAGGWGANWTANHDHTRFVVVEAPNAAAQTFRVLTGWRK